MQQVLGDSHRGEEPCSLASSSPESLRSFLTLGTVQFGNDSNFVSLKLAPFLEETIRNLSNPDQKLERERDTGQIPNFVYWTQYAEASSGGRFT